MYKLVLIFAQDKVLTSHRFLFNKKMGEFRIQDVPKDEPLPEEGTDARPG